MTTIRQINREQTEQLALRLFEKTKERIMARKPHESIHRVNLRLIPIMVRRNFEAAP